MAITLFYACPCAGAAADAVVSVGDEHDLVPHVVAEFVVVFVKGLVDQLQNVSAADLVAPPTSNTFFLVDLSNESRDPFSASAGHVRTHDLASFR